MTELAVIVPTRSRPQNIPAIVQAWRETGAFAVADLVVAWDLDDMQADKYQAYCARTPEVRTAIMPEWKPLVPKLNQLALLGAPDYRAIAFMGDDHLPRTKMWAHTLIQHHTTNPGWIWYGQDGFQNQRLPTWWSMDSKIIKALGGMVPSGVQHLYCDNTVKELGMKAACLGYDERLMVEHMHPIAGKGKMDAQYERVNRAQQYERDAVAFHAWVNDGIDRDASLIRSAAGR